MALNEPSTKVAGYWIDPLGKISGAVKKSKTATIGTTVGMLKKMVIEQVNKAYSLDPELVSSDMVVRRYPKNLKNDDDLHTTIKDTELDGLVVLVHPTGDAAGKVKERFSNLQDAEEETTELIEFIRNSDEVTSDSEDDVKDSLVDLFKGLRKDMADHKAETARLNEETARLNRSLRQEQKERKADSASHKEETAQLKEEAARLKRSLRQEQQERKADSASHKEETAQLKEESAQLKEEAARLNRSLRQEQQERKADSASHKEEAARQDTKLGELERELRNAKKQHNSDIRDISELTRKLVPIHLRILLDHGRKRILEFMKYKTWDELRGGREIHPLTDLILEGLLKVNEDSLSRDTVFFLCSYNNVRKEGDRIAHNASQNEIKNAVMTKRNSTDGMQLEELYKFVYATSI